MSPCSCAAKIYMVTVQRTSNNGFLASSASYMSCLERLCVDRQKQNLQIENKSYTQAEQNKILYTNSSINIW